MKKEIVVYYLIKGKALGKRVKDSNEFFGTDYLYSDGEWVYDKANLIMDKLMGYDPWEPPGSPYWDMSATVLDEIEEITEKQALEFIKNKT